MTFPSPESEQRYDAVVRVSGGLVVGLDFDGTLAPIVDDPTAARIHPDGPGVLAALAGHVRAVALVTGRPARQVVRLGHLDEVADSLADGALLLVRGQYGNERWDSSTRVFSAAQAPAGLAALVAELPSLLAAAGCEQAYVEEKGLAVAVHTRRLVDPDDAYDRLRPRLAEAAERHGLAVEPGRRVLEVRAPGMDKGHALRDVVAELQADAVLFAGDDLGDIEAFEAARSLRDEDGLPALLVCSGSVEEQALADLADLVVPGPDGIMALLRRLTDDAPAR